MILQLTINLPSSSFTKLGQDSSIRSCGKNSILTGFKSEDQGCKSVHSIELIGMFGKSSTIILHFNF